MYTKKNPLIFLFTTEIKKKLCSSHSSLKTYCSLSQQLLPTSNSRCPQIQNISPPSTFQIFSCQRQQLQYTNNFSPFILATDNNYSFNYNNIDHNSSNTMVEDNNTPSDLPFLHQL